MIEARNRALVEWYTANRRPLPWRETSDPWPILVSEVMAQQTQVARVADRYGEFMRCFPTPAAFAAATDRQVLTIWSGLGYNSRALRLREAARIIDADGWPTTVADLVRLPGIGPYTAAAVACFAFGVQVPAVDTNLKRVIGRWLGTPLSGREIHEAAVDQLGDASAVEWNQAIMDLGATLCRPRPDCESCPVVSWCADPEVYEPPRSQGPWEGSERQARGAIVRALLAQPLSLQRLSEVTGLGSPRCEDAVNALVRDALVTQTAEGFAIAASESND